MTKHVGTITQMIKNKEYLITNGEYYKSVIHDSIVHIKTFNKRLIDLQILKDDLMDGVTYNDWKLWHDTVIQRISVQVAMHYKASELMYTGWSAYLNDYKLKGRADSNTHQAILQT